MRFVLPRISAQGLIAVVFRRFQTACFLPIMARRPVPESAIFGRSCNGGKDGPQEDVTSSTDGMDR